MSGRFNNCCCGGYCKPLPLVDEWENITKVQGYVSTDPVDPYSRPWHFISGTGACVEGYAGTTPTCGGTSSGLPMCAIYGFDGVLIPRPGAPPTGVLPCSAAAGAMVDRIIDNCYRKTGSKTRLPRTCMGWKGVAAYAVWPGIPFGYTDCTCDCYNATDCTPPANPQFKYSTVKETETGFATSTYISYDPDPAYNDTTTTAYSHEWTQTASVDRYGNVTRTGHKHSRRAMTDMLDTTSGSNYDNSDNCNGSLATGASLRIGIPEIPSAVQPITITCDGSISWNGHSAASVAAMNALNINAPPASTTYHGSGETLVVTSTGSAAVFVKTLTELSVTYYGTSHQVRTLDADGSTIDDGTYEWRYEWKQELSGAILFADVYQDAVDMLDLWRLQDDSILPWRDSNDTWALPYLIRDATASIPNIIWTVDDACRFPSDTGYTGAVRGGPLPYGYGNPTIPYFDFNHINWDMREISGTCTPCEISLGAWTTMASVTRQADYYEGGYMFGKGAHAAQRLNFQMGTGAIGPAAISGVLLQKWAETLEQWPSVNASRPCGADRDVIDKRTDCASTTKRWSTARAICGYLGVVSATQASPGGVVTITTAANHHLLASGDSVEFVNSSGTATVANLGTAVYAATRVSDTVFTVPFAGTLTAYSSGGLVRSYLASPGSPDPRNFWDTCPAHRYIIREWNGNARAAALDHTVAPYIESALIEGTKAPSPTEPTVLYCSPNAADDFGASGVRAAWGGAISADTCFGTEWHLDFVQAMDDPFWLPDTDCGAEDSLPCVHDHDYRYPPQVEPLTALPGGYPALPGGLTLYPASGHAMPDGVGYGTACGTLPVAAGSIHAIRSYWLSCSDWKIATNHNCATML